jgi:prepilin-type N-terminal cleavage/methylation domain-containing protein
MRNSECGVGATAPIIPHSALRIPHSQSAFTLLELLIVILIISILASLALSALGGATEAAREQRTRAIINKLDQLVMEKYESYRTRAVPIKIPPNTAPRVAAQMRLFALRELMRLELPDRIYDLCNQAEANDLQSDDTLNAINDFKDALRASVSSIPAVARSYKRHVARVMNPATGWTAENESSECLFLIISSMRDGDKNATDFFSSSEIADTDGDGVKEVLDAWGKPIAFLRWAPGYAEQPGADGAWGIVGTDDDSNGVQDDVSEAGWLSSDDVKLLTMQSRNAAKAPDPFDPLKVDPRWGSTAVTYPYALWPLIFSAGRDRSYDVNVGTVIYATTTNVSSVPQVPPNDPYYSSTPGGLPEIGQVGDTDSDGSTNGYADNITNHYQETP